MTTYVKFMLGSYEFASRNRREVSVVSSLGHTAAVSDVRPNAGVEYEGEVIVYHRRRRKHRNVRVRRVLTLLDYLVRLPPHLRGFRARCLSCHDLIALTIGWMTTVGRPRSQRPHLVYDSHEFELGRNTARPRSKFELAVIKRWEGFLIKRCAFVISVNDSIADRLLETHGLKQRPLVVRSTPSTWTLDPRAIRVRRDQFCQALNLPPQTFVVMYHGGIMPNRGIEIVLSALIDVPETAAVILGNGDADYLTELDLLARRLGVHERVLFHPAVPMPDLRHYVAAADVGVVLFQAVYESYYLSLPNKLFENIQALTPVIGSDYPELTRIIQGYQIGLTVDPSDPTAIAGALNRIRCEVSLQMHFANNLPAAKAELCWERERQVLQDAYLTLLGEEGPSHG